MSRGLLWKRFVCLSLRNYSPQPRTLQANPWALAAGVVSRDVQSIVRITPKITRFLLVFRGKFTYLATSYESLPHL